MPLSICWIAGSDSWSVFDEIRCKDTRCLAHHVCLYAWLHCLVGSIRALAVILVRNWHMRYRCTTCSMVTEMIFVFGSNLAGRHGKGAALFAVKHHGAIYGQGIGLQGQSYAIPTKGYHMETLSLGLIQPHVQAFRTFAVSRPDLTFQLTPIGCGLAGYEPQDIAWMFRDAPKNILLPEEFKKVLFRS